MKKQMILFCACAALTAAAERAFTSAQTVSEAITGEESVRVACAANTFVSFTGANTYSGGTTIASGGVIVSNVTALGTGPITCASGTAIRICADFTGETDGLQGLIDRIVVEVAEGESEPWVSFQLMGNGLKNSVDFSKQPYLWLGAPGDGASSYAFTGSIVPYDNEYRFGYARGANGEARGLSIPSSALTDAADGTPRRVLIRGDGNTSLNGGSFTGGIVVEGPAFLSVGNGNGLGSNTTNVTLRNGARINFKNQSQSYPARLAFRIEGTNVFHSCGADREVCTVFKGPIEGWGLIRLTDQGGVRFTSPSNTFTGSLRLDSGAALYGIEIGIGDGANCSWAGDAIILPDAYNNSVRTNNYVKINCSSNVTLTTDLGTTGGPLVKAGSGTLTLAKPFLHTPRRSDQPIVHVKGGTLRRGASETTARTGIVRLDSGTALDLNGLATPGLWLPSGKGRVINYPSGGVTFKGPADVALGTAFKGALEGDSTVSVQTGTTWLLGTGVALGGQLHVAAGDVCMEAGIQTTKGVEVQESGRLLFAPEAVANGLEMEIWKNGKAWTGSGHTAKFTEARALMASRAADVTGDMADFLNGTFASGVDPSQQSTPNAFTKAMGSTSIDNFIARFSGFFTAETSGSYGFRVYGDDGASITLDETNRVAQVAAGTHGTAGSGTVWLDAGAHPVEVQFLEEGGWEYVRVEMLAPGSTTWQVVPVSLLSVRRATSLGAVTGAGALVLQTGATWPGEMDLAGFTGLIIANDATAAETAGTVAPATATLAYDGPGSLNDGWALKGTAAWGPVTVDALDAATLCGAKDARGSLNTTAKIPVDQPFSVAFDFSAVKPWGYAGDGFALVLHDGTTTIPYCFYYEGAGDLLGASSAYGALLYLMNNDNRLFWVRDRVNLGAIATNVSAFTMNKLKNDPMRVTLAWDLEKLVLTLEKDGTTWAMTNTAAATDIPARFANGAYLGVWGSCGGYYTAMRVANMVFEHGDTTATEALTFNGTLRLTGGTVTATHMGRVAETRLAAALDVTGAATLTVAENSVESGMTLACTGDAWSFALANPEAKLTLTGPFTFPDVSADAPIEVSFTGEASPRRRVLADLTGVTGNAADALAFRLAPDLPSSLKLTYANRLLSVVDAVGTVLILR